VLPTVVNAPSLHLLLLGWWVETIRSKSLPLLRLLVARGSLAPVTVVRASLSKGFILSDK